jgi:hypothetical protein
MHVHAYVYIHLHYFPGVNAVISGEHTQALAFASSKLPLYRRLCLVWTSQMTRSLAHMIFQRHGHSWAHMRSHRINQPTPQHALILPHLQVPPNRSLDYTQFLPWFLEYRRLESERENHRATIEKVKLLQIRMAKKDLDWFLWCQRIFAHTSV